MISYWDFQDEGMQVTQKTPIFFADRGHRVTFMVHSETTARAVSKKDIHPGIKVLRFDMPMKWMNEFNILKRPRQLILFSLLCFWAAFRFCRQGNKPDIVYAAEADAVLIGVILSRVYGVPLIIRFYGVSRLAAYFDFENGKLKGLDFHHYFTKLAMTRRADMAIITDDGSRGLEIFKALNSRVINIKFWRNGVDKPKLGSLDKKRLKKRLGFTEEDFILLTLCRLDCWKGVDLAIQALHRALNTGLKNIKLLIVGHGPELAALKKLVSNLQINEYVYFVGPVPHSEVYAYFHLTDIFLSLYRYSNIGNPLWEALNSGSCIITLDTGRTGTVIIDDFNGRLIKYEKNEELLASHIADIIISLYRNPNLRRKLRNGAREYSKKELWTWDERLNTELNALYEVLPWKEQDNRRD